ncbi:MAG: vWA domain-containing protein, partial [Planctomycetota bacterium]|nr:vWA domain-containing protein [Planctomycetota bacterium]
MNFANWQLLFFLVLPFALLIWAWTQKNHQTALPFDGGQQSQGRGWGYLLNLADSIPILLLAIVIVILAGPTQLGTPVQERELKNIQFCLDVSGSMTANFGTAKRYDAAMEAINDFIDFREGDTFGLTIFGVKNLQWVPLTTDTSAFKCAPPFLRPESLPPGFGGTMIGSALQSCQKVLVEREEGDRMIILVSDGNSFDLNAPNDENLAKKLKADDIVVYAVHVSNTSLPPELATLTTITGGEAFNPGDKNALRAVFRKIDQMQQTKLKPAYAVRQDFFWPFSIGGMTLIAISLATAFGL